MQKHQSADSLLSAVIPVDLLRRPASLKGRVLDLARHPGMAKLRMVVAHNDRGSRHDRTLVRKLAAFPHVTLVSRAFHDGAVNSGLLRNRAAEHVDSATMLLLDADLYPLPDLFLDSARLVASGAEKLVVLPCLYLTKWASSRLQAGRETPGTILDGYLSFRRRYFQHMANPSSVVVLRTRDYRDLGGFDEAFHGHGYEDFDFMLRLAMRHELIPRTEDLLKNKSFRAPLLAEGFRKYLGRLSLPRLLDRQVVFHLYHDKPRGDAYYHARAENAERLLGKLRAWVGGGNVTDTAAGHFLIEEFFACCGERGLAAQDFFVLFDTRPGHVDRLGGWMDRARYLLGFH
ncbi:galactosyltransferase-related protein [Cupriavidus sp. 2TAF22]|uniref:galactosyltransferase-related protein n=1 Tax=unclassified Cupriavidus TaxID=2640874 RepID=UPI003F8E22FF